MIEVLMVMAIIFLLTSIAIPIFANARRQARETALVSDSVHFFNALMRYYVDKGAFPSEADLDLSTFAPLSTDQYFTAVDAFSDKLDGGSLYFYAAPDVGGVDQQFIVVARHTDDPSIITAIVSTDIVDEDGDYIEGVFIITEQDLADAGL